MNKATLPTLIGLMLWATMSSAEGLSISKDAQKAQSASAYWTAERLSSAVPLPLPTASEPVPSARLLAQPLRAADQVSQPGRGPTEQIKPDTTRLFEPRVPDPQAATESAPGAEPSSYGTEGADFSSSRVIPAPAGPKRYPFRAAGKLFFTGPDGLNYVCSGSVIRPRLVATAGHCVYDAELREWNRNFLFIPAYHKGNAPYGQWDWAWVITTGAWANGGGFVPNAGDFAVIEMVDNSNGKRIGSITGYYGYSTYALYPNHVRMLGYPVAFDGGQWMHEVNAQSFRMNEANCVDYGSDMSGGSSGGPWIQNFGALAAGQSVSPGNATNRLVGITSYGPIDLARRYQGSSTLDVTFANNSGTGILDLACAHRAGNCP